MILQYTVLRKPEKSIILHNFQDFVSYIDSISRGCTNFY